MMNMTQPKNHIEEFPVISTPIKLQEKFLASLTLIQSQKQKLKSILAKAEDLFNTLLQREFKGGSGMRNFFLVITIFVLMVSCQGNSKKQIDTDGDGVYDEKDECPYEYGLEEFNGCPDTDSDGIIDSEDECPNDYGLEEFNGCPDADRMKLLASDCFKALSLTEQEINDYIDQFEISENSIINYLHCELISDYINKVRESNQKYEDKIKELTTQRNNIQKQINEGTIKTVQKIHISNVLYQSLIVLKKGKYYLLELGSGGDCSMGTLKFNENTYNWQDVYVRETPLEENYKLHQMRIIDISENFEELNQKMIKF